MSRALNVDPTIRLEYEQRGCLEERERETERERDSITRIDAPLSLGEIFRIFRWRVPTTNHYYSIFAMEIREWTLFAIPYVPFTLPGLVVWLAALIKFIPPPLPLHFGLEFSFLPHRPVLATD